MKAGRHYPSGGLDQALTCLVSCKKCKLSERRFLTARAIHRVIRGEIVCPVCRKPLSVSGVDEGR